ncbi:hypothetical protein TNIN_326861 [Trichonephila inaurata madagascariensis]|uniref:Uncharacterized protein n=1 Tax=Trichonephila inaurata madagascariensis TaxID=2747483 RepID=A0A8X6WN84_9ARAC|nr:hypothetical protein TNIN_326861 [Trichonephila inaurata madagascariensis]
MHDWYHSIYLGDALALQCSSQEKTTLILFNAYPQALIYSNGIKYLQFAQSITLVNLPMNISSHSEVLKAKSHFQSINSSRFSSGSESYKLILALQVFGD